MKKILVFLGLFILIYIGGSYYLGNSFVENYNEGFKNSFSSDIGIKSTHEKGIFRSKVIDMVTFPKDSLGLEDENFIMECEVDIIHPLFSLISGIKGEGVIRILSHKDLVDKLLKNKDIIKLNFKVDRDNNGNLMLETSEISYSDHVGTIAISPVIMNINYIGEGISVLDFKQNNININIVDDLSLILDGIKYDATYDKPVKFENLMYEIVSSKTNFRFENLIYKIKDKNLKEISLEIPNFKDEGEIKISDGLVNIFSSSSADKVVFRLANDVIELNDIKSKVSFNRFNELFYKKLFKIIENNTISNLSNSDIKTLVELFIDKNPSINLDNLSFKYEDKYNISLNFKSGMNKFDLSNPMNVLGNIYLNGKTSFSKSFINYMFKDDIDSKNMFISSEILKENGDNYDISFKYDKNQMDVILNEKIGVGQILSTMF